MTESRLPGSPPAPAQPVCPDTTAADVAGAVAHDLNNLLTVITGYADFLRHDPQLQPQQRDAVVEICRAAERAAAATRQLLALGSRPNPPAEKK